MQPSIKIRSDDKTLKPGLEPFERNKTDQFSMDHPFSFKTKFYVIVELLYKGDTLECNT